MYVIFMFPLIRNVDIILHGNISLNTCKYDRIKILGLGNTDTTFLIGIEQNRYYTISYDAVILSKYFNYKISTKLSLSNPKLSC